MSAKGIVGVVVGLIVAVGLFVVLVLWIETQTNIGTAWVAIFGVVIGVIVAVPIEFLRAGSADKQERAAWRRDRRFVAYENALAASRQLGRGLFYLNEGKIQRDDLAEAEDDWGDAKDLVQMWGSPAARQWHASLKEPLMESARPPKVRLEYLMAVRDQLRAIASDETVREGGGT